MRVEIHGVELPGRWCETYENVHVGLQRGREVIDIHSADEQAVRWVMDVDVRREGDAIVDIRGPYVHGRPGNRFLYLSWGTVDDRGAFTMFRRAKLLLGDVEPTVLEAALQPESHLVAHLALTGPDGGPRCGSVRPPHIQWAAGP